MDARAAIGSLYQAFLDADEVALARCIGDAFELHSAIPGALAGPHRGAAGIREVALSEHHAVLMDRWVGEVGTAKLDAHVAIVFGLDGARPEIGFLYVQNPAALDCLR
jgi:hypothetical protein